MGTGKAHSAADRGAAKVAAAAAAVQARALPAITGTSKPRSRTRPKHVMQILQWRLQQVQQERERVQAEHTIRAH